MEALAQGGIVGAGEGTLGSTTGFVVQLARVKIRIKKNMISRFFFIVVSSFDDISIPCGYLFTKRVELPSHNYTVKNFQKWFIFLDWV